jgi:site-specific DNA-cytosine methylase
MYRYLSVNSGIGSFDLPLQKLHFWTPVCYVEANPRSIKILDYRFREESLQAAPIWDNFYTFDGRPWRRCVDCIAGITEATATSKEPTTNFTDKLIQLVQTVEPSYILWQFSHSAKKEAITSADYLANGLEILGYSPSIFKVRAGDMGADYRRTRIFVCAEVAAPGTTNDGHEQLECRLSTPCRATRWTSNGRVYRRANKPADWLERLDSLGRCSDSAMVAAISTVLDTGVVF